MNFGVITRVPDHRKGERGNLASAMGEVFLAPNGGYDDDVVPLHDALGAPMLALSMLVPNFRLSEILVLDGSGREVAGAGRKPDKWDVDCEEFDTIEAAVARAREVRDW